MSNVSSDSAIIQTYNKIRASLPVPGLIVVLEIAADVTRLVTTFPGAPVSVLVLPIGALKTSSSFFHTHPPTPAEVENAINFIEDELMKIVKQIAPGSQVYTSDPVIKQIASMADGVMPGQFLSRESLERLFGRFADISMGAPARSAGFSFDSAWAAVLLILREVMHHLNFESIAII